MNKDESDSAGSGSLSPDSGRASGQSPSARGTTSPSPSREVVRARFDGFELDEANARLLAHEQPIALAPTPFAVLCALVRQPGELITKAALLDAVWGHRFISDSALKTAISDLRAVLGDDARCPRYIETVSRRGYRFIGVTSASSVPQPAAATGSLATAAPMRPITGRVDELARLQAAWSRTCAGQRSIVWVAGDPGIGKTTLIDHFVAALDDGVSTRGQCIEQFAAGEPYFPVLEALAELCRNDSGVLPLLRAVAPSLLLEFPWLSTPQERDTLRQERSAAQPYSMLRELSEFIDRYTERCPLLLVIEDLHWGDHATIQLIDHIARRRGSARLMLLGSFRIAEIVIGDHPLKVLRSELRLHHLCEEIVLDGFSEKEVADYVAQRSTSISASETFVRALHERTDGLPLFLTHVVNDCISRAELGTRDRSAPVEALEISLPESLAEIIDQYIARLTDEQLVILKAAAVCGVEFRVQTVAAALGETVALVAGVCNELASDHLWLIPPAQSARHADNLPYSFRHALVREVLYKRIGPLARVELHRKVGVALEQERTAGVNVTAAELAVHFECGAEPKAALRHLVEAAQSALQRFGTMEATTLAQRGLGLLERTEPGNDRDAFELSLWTICGVSAAKMFGASSTEAKTALSRAYAILPAVPKHPMRALLLYEYGFVLCLRGEYAEALALAERTEALWQQTQDSALLLGACTINGIVHMLRGQPWRSREWLERGLSLNDTLERALTDAPAVGDPQITLLGYLAVQLVDLAQIEQARERLDALSARARHLSQPLTQCVAIWLQALCEVRLDNASRVAALAEEMEAIVAEFPFAHGRVAAQLFGGWAAARLGDPLKGYHAMRAAYEENLRLEMLSGSSETLGYTAEALLLAGDFDRASAELDEALQIANALGERMYLPRLFLIEAAIADARGDAAAARGAIDRALMEARERKAPWLELKALLDLCKRDDATAADRRTLRALVNRLPEATNTAAFATAKALLDAREPAA